MKQRFFFGKQRFIGFFIAKVQAGDDGDKLPPIANNPAGAKPKQPLPKPKMYKSQQFKTLSHGSLDTKPARNTNENGLKD